MQRNSGDGSSLSSDESAFLPNKEEDVLGYGKWLAEELSWSTDSSSCTSLVSRSPVKARKHSKTLKELDAATKSELEAIIEESKRLLAETKTKKVTDESKLKALATPQRRPNNSTFITPQPQRQRQNLRAPNTSATPGNYSTDQFLASFRKDAKEAREITKKNLDNIVVESKKQHEKSRSVINRNTNAEGAKTRKDLAARIAEAESNIERNNRRQFEEFQKNLLDRLGQPPDIHYRDSSSTATTAATTISGGAQEPSKRRRPTRKAQKPNRWV